MYDILYEFIRVWWLFYDFFLVLSFVVIIVVEGMLNIFVFIFLLFIDIIF